MTLTPSTNDAIPISTPLEVAESELTHYIQQALTSLESLTHDYTRYTQNNVPTLISITSQRHSAELLECSLVYDANASQHHDESTQWHDKDGPRIKKMINELTYRDQQLKIQTNALVKESERIEEIVKRFETIEEGIAFREASTRVGMCSLTIPCLRRLLLFLSRHDLHALLGTSYAYNKCFERGALWYTLSCELVRSVIQAQKAAAMALESKRRKLGGLNHDVHTMNYLAAAARTPIPSMNSNNYASSSTPVTYDFTPPPASLQIVVPVSSAPSKKSSANGAPSAPSKSELFARALHHLQTQVDPALSEFEDLSLKLGSHQRIITFLTTQMEENRHKLGLALLSVGNEQHHLQMRSKTKDRLAQRMTQIEKDTQIEKAKQAAIQKECDDGLRRIKAERNMRKNIDDFIQANPNPNDPDDADNPDEPQELNPTQVLNENITKLKSQKKLLIKGVKSLQVDLESVKHEKEEYSKKLEELKEKLKVLNL